MMAVSRQSLVPLVLMAIPLLIIGILAFRTYEADHAVLQAEHAEAATVRLRLVGAVAQSAIEQLATGAVARVASTLSAAIDPISALRNLILAKDMEFVLVDEAGRRRFPSEDSPETSPSTS